MILLLYIFALIIITYIVCSSIFLYKIYKKKKFVHNEEYYTIWAKRCTWSIKHRDLNDYIETKYCTYEIKYCQDNDKYIFEMYGHDPKSHSYYEEAAKIYSQFLRITDI